MASVIHSGSCMLQMLGDLLLAHIRQLFEWVLPPCLRFVRKAVKEIQPSLETNLSQSCMRLFYSLLDEFRPSGSDEAPVAPKGSMHCTIAWMLLTTCPNHLVCLSQRPDVKPLCTRYIANYHTVQRGTHPSLLCAAMARQDWHAAARVWLCTAKCRGESPADHVNVLRLVAN